MPVTTELSLKIKTLSFGAMVSVLFIHSNTLGIFPEAAEWNVFLQRLLTRTLTSWAVPFFFMVSGFWFATGSYENWYKFIKKKVQTLLVPYLLWALIGTLIVAPLIVFNNYVNGVPLLERTALGYSGVWNKINCLFGLTNAGPCGNLALWYVRSLFVFFLFAPLWKWLYQRMQWIPFYGSLLLVLFFNEYNLPFFSVKAGSIGWILIGMGLANRKWDLNGSIKRGGAILLGSLWVGVSVLMALGSWHIPLNINPMLGCLFLWMIYDCVLVKDIPKWMLNKTFWVYCLHGCLAGYFLSGIPYVIGRTNLVTFGVTVITPVLMLVICILLSKACLLLFPKLYNLLCGGRV